MQKLPAMKISKEKLFLCQLLLVVYTISTNQVHAQSADVIFIVDTSSSIEISGIDYNSKVNLIQDIASVFDIGQETGQTRVGAVTFSDGYVQVGFRLSACSNQEDLQFRVSTMRLSIEQRLSSNALSKMVNDMFESRHGGRNGVARVIVVIADGSSAGSFSGMVKVALLFLQKDVVVITANVGQEGEGTELQETASNPELYFHLSGTDNALMSTAKTKMIRKIIEVCSRQYVDVTIAYDNNPMSDQDKHDRLDLQQLEKITRKLQASECYARISVISGLGLERFPSDQGSKRSSARAPKRKWRKVTSRQRRASEGGPNRLPDNIPSDDQNKRLVLVLSSRHESEFRSIVDQMHVVMSKGTKVLVVLDGTVSPSNVLAWQQVLGFSRVIVLKETKQDISDSVEKFVCDVHA